MSFTVGQKVVHVRPPNCRPFPGFGEILPTEGAVYTVRETLMTSGALHIRLVEIVNEPKEYIEGFRECCFHHRAFRPVAEKPASMDIIRSIVLDPSKPIADDPNEPAPGRAPIPTPINTMTPEQIASVPRGIL